MSSEILASKGNNNEEAKNSLGENTKVSETKETEINNVQNSTANQIKAVILSSSIKRKPDNIDKAPLSKLQKTEKNLNSDTTVTNKLIDVNFEGIHEAEKGVLELASAAASSQVFTETIAADEVVETDVSHDAASVLGNLTNIAACNTAAPVEIVVEQDAPVKTEQQFSQGIEVSESSNAVAEPVQTNTATVAAPQGVNPAMMSNLLHTAAAVAAAQNVAAATVQVIPGQSAGTIQLVPATDVQRTQELMAAGMPPQNVNQSPEELAKITQPVFSYLVTSQGTLIAAHASDGTELISGSSNDSETIAKPKPKGRSRHSKTPKKKELVPENDMNDQSKCFQSNI